MPEKVINLQGINKKYRVNFTKQSLIGNFLSFLKRTKRLEQKNEIVALNDINISVKKGETVGIIGENASGKTTLLRVISKITVPTFGTVEVKGNVAGLLDLGAGFHPELSGRENIFLDASLYGLSRKEIEVRYEDIVNFSGLGEFINAQVKTYSQGMLVRLGFAIAVHVEPDIFLIDDSLAVGDEEFQRKCINKITQLKEKGKTIIVVSHDLDSISRICERGILIKAGQIIKDSSMHKVIMRYVEAVGDKKAIACIDCNKLSVIFNNGKIIILWDGKPLTKNFGGFISVQVMDKWIFSWKARWNVIENNDNNWKVEGFFDKYGLKIILEGIVNHERLFNFHAKITCSRSIELKKVSFGFMMSEKYNKFLKENCVEDIEEIRNTGQDWTDIYRTDEANSPLVLDSELNLPVIKINFKNYKHSSFNLIQSAGKGLDARVMQTQINLSGESKFLETKTDIIESLAELELLDKSKFRIFVQNRQATRQIESDELKLELKNNSIHLFYNNSELTKGKNIIFGFYCSGHYFNLLDGAWTLRKDASNSMSLRAEFKDLELTLMLRLSLCKNSMKWEIKTEGAESQKFTDLFMRIHLTEEYRKYFNLDSEQEFCAASEHSEQINLLDSKAGFIGLCTKDYALPAIAFEVVKGNCLELQNAGFDMPGRILVDKMPVLNETSGAIIFLDSLIKKNAFIEDKQKKYETNMIVSNDALKIGFDKERISIYYNGNEITDGEGFCSGTYFKGRWHESKHLIKEISKEGNKLKVVIRRRIPDVVEFWEISIDQEEICWSIIAQSSKPLVELYCKAGIILKSDYRQWAHSFDQGEFCDALKINQTMDLDDSNNMLLGLRVNGDETVFPSLFFERKNAVNPRGLIIQGDEKNRMLMFKFDLGKDWGNNRKQEVFSGKVRLCAQNCWQKNILEHRRQNFSLITENELQLLAAFKEIRLLFKDRQLTKRCGLKVSLNSEEIKFDSENAYWRIKKSEKDKIEIELTWDACPVIQKWSFCRKNRAIDWTVTLMLEQRLKLKKLSIGIFSDFTFNRWINGNTKGEINFKKFKGKPITLLEKRSNFIGIYNDEISMNNPALLLNPSVDMNEWFFHLYVGQEHEEIVWGLDSIIGPEGTSVAAGHHEIFKGRLLLSDDEEKISDLIPSSGIGKHSEIFSGSFAVKAEEAKIKLFWNGQEVTKTLCLYSAFFNGKYWIDSSLAKWQFVVSSARIIADLSWNQLAVSQRWELTLSNENELLWKIDTNVKQKDINSVVAALMLNDKYNYYKTDSVESGKFSPDFNENCWEQLALTKRGVNVATKNKKFPGVFFEGSVPRYDYNNIVENSDKLHSGRVLKCEAAVPKSNSVKQYAFSSEIKIILKGADSGTE